MSISSPNGKNPREIFVIPTHTFTKLLIKKHLISTSRTNKLSTRIYIYSYVINWEVLVVKKFNGEGIYVKLGAPKCLYADSVWTCCMIGSGKNISSEKVLAIMMRCHFSLLNFLFLFLGNSKSESSRQVTWNGKRCPVPGSFHRNLPICLCKFPGPRGERFFTKYLHSIVFRVLERDTPSLSNLAFAI